MRKIGIPIWQLLVGMLTGIAILVYAVTQLVLFIFGVVAIPDDAASTLGKASAVINWLISTPWWVAVFVVLGGCVVVVSLIALGVRGLVAEQKLTVALPPGYLTSEDSVALLAAFKEFTCTNGELRGSIEQLRHDYWSYSKTVQQAITQAGEINAWYGENSKGLAEQLMRLRQTNENAQFAYDEPRNLILRLEQNVSGMAQMVRQIAGELGVKLEG